MSLGYLETAREIPDAQCMHVDDINQLHPCIADPEVSIANPSYNDHSRLMERSTLLPSFKKLKGKSPSFSTLRRPMTDTANVRNTHPVPNDTVPSTLVQQPFALGSPNLAGSLVSSPNSGAPHLSTPPYSHPMYQDPLDWITESKLDADKYSHRHETQVPTTRGHRDFQGSVDSFFGTLRGQQTLSGGSIPSNHHRPSSSSGGSIDSHTSTAALSFIPLQNKSVGHITYSQELSAPIPIQPQASSAHLRQQCRKAPTPPSLISPSLTTTKVSKSLSTMHSISGSSSAQSNGSVKSVSTPPSLPVRNNSTKPGSSAIHNPKAQNQCDPTLQDVSSDPRNCKCIEHYRYAILSTVVPIPLNLCFEWLYSSQGLGQEDRLIKKAHATVNSSLQIDISPWAKPQPETHPTDTSEWETKRRQLHYSVTFKIPMCKFKPLVILILCCLSGSSTVLTLKGCLLLLVAKTSTLCSEIQEILEYNTHSIRLHTESTTPNVLYGDMFSTVNQVCLTLEAPGMTRIKCFAEVKFKKSILWSSRIEASAMQGCSLYYKDLIRQLMEMEPMKLQELHVVRPSVTRSSTADSSQTTQNLQHSSVSVNLAVSNTTTFLEAAPVMARSSSHGVSPAHSLLAQQYLKNPPTILKTAQPSTTSPDLCTEATTVSNTTTSAASIGDVTSTSTLKLSLMDRSASAFWRSIILTSVDFFSKPLSTITTKFQDRDTTSSGHDTCAGTVSERALQGNQSSTAVLGPGGSKGAVEIDGSNQELAVVSTVPDTLYSTLQSDARATIPVHLISSFQTSNRALWLVLVFAMIMSVLNLWSLFRTVSSMAIIIHNNHRVPLSEACSTHHHWLDRSDVFHDGSITTLQPFSTHLRSLPLHVQAFMLRTEMDDLTHLLQILSIHKEK